MSSTSTPKAEAPPMCCVVACQEPAAGIGPHSRQPMCQHHLAGDVKQVRRLEQNLLTNLTPYAAVSVESLEDRQRLIANDILCVSEAFANVRQYLAECEARTLQWLREAHDALKTCGGTRRDMQEFDRELARANATGDVTEVCGLVLAMDLSMSSLRDDFKKCEELPVDAGVRIVSDGVRELLSSTEKRMQILKEKVESAHKERDCRNSICCSSSSSITQNATQYNRQDVAGAIAAVTEDTHSMNHTLSPTPSPIIQLASSVMWEAPGRVVPAVGGLCSPLSEPCPIQPPVVQFKAIEVNRETLSRVRKLGAGSFSEVWLAKWYGILDVAVKTPKSDSTMTPAMFIEEARILYQLSHPKIVSIRGVCTEMRGPTDQIYIVTEFMENGALLDYLRKHSSGQSRLTMSTLLDIAYQVADGMAYLEEKKIVHRNLRAASVLVGRDNLVKVAGFGFARVLPEYGICQPESSDQFPIRWTAPEAMYDNRFSTKSDVWSFGVVLYEILTYGSFIYVGMSIHEVTLFVMNPRNRLPVPRSTVMSGSDEEIALRIHQQIMMQCWHQNPEERPTFMTLRNDFENCDITLECAYDWLPE